MANSMNITLVLFAVILGLIIAIEDFRINKIRNYWLKIGFAGGLLYLLVGFVLALFNYWQIVSWQIFSLNYFIAVLLNTFLAFVVAFTLWHFKLWAGGDAKLFILYIFLIPLSYYENWYFKYWPGLMLLINIVVPIFIYLLLKMLIYPFRLAWNYIKSPKLLREYFSQFKSNHKLDKEKIKEYLDLAFSFLLILIFFQILRTRVLGLLQPYLGSLLSVSYLFLGLLIFQPLRVWLKKYVLAVGILLSLYFIIGALYFKQLIFQDLHKLFAMQMLFMLTYFYIFKYGKDLGLFLYNSSEVLMIPLVKIKAGLYINKSFIKQIMGDRLNLAEFETELTTILEENDRKQLFALITKKDSSENRSRREYKVISFFTRFRPETILKIFKDLWGVRKQEKLDKIFLEKIKPQLNPGQWQRLDNLLNNTDEVSAFLKSIHGKLTAAQAEKLKALLEERNQEIIKQDLQPIKQIILHKTFAFAPFMILGVIITLLTRTSLIHLFYQYILGK